MHDWSHLLMKRFSFSIKSHQFLKVMASHCSRIWAGRKGWRHVGTTKSMGTGCSGDDKL
jgi:hypothetical protein